jgi:uncharacterized membrane protein (UPF0182 family)
MSKITIIVIWLIGVILIPVYVTFTKFGEIQFGGFYSGVVSTCLVIFTMICCAVWVETKGKNEK